MAITMPGGYQLDLDTGKTTPSKEGYRQQLGEYTPTGTLDDALGVAKQFSWGLNAGLFAAPDWVVRNFAKDALGMSEKDAPQFANLYKSITGPETSARNVQERYAKTIGDGIGMNLGVSGILKRFASAGAMGKDLATNAGFLKKTSKSIMDDLRNNPGKVLRQDLAWGSISGATEAMINEGLAPGEEKTLLQSLAPALTPLAYEALPVNLLRRAIPGMREAVSRAGGTGAAALAPGAGSLAPELAASAPKGLQTITGLGTQGVERQVGRALSPLVEGGVGNTPEIAQTLARSEELAASYPEFAELYKRLTPAERSLYAPLLALQAASGAKLTGGDLAAEIGRRQTLEDGFRQAVNSLGGAPSRQSIEQVLLATRDRLSSGEMGTVLLKGQEGIVPTGMTPFTSHAQAGEAKRGALRSLYNTLDENVNSLYNSISLRNLEIDPSTLGKVALEEGEEAVEGTLAALLANIQRNGIVPLKGEKGEVIENTILLSPTLTPATLAGVNRIKALLPQAAEEGAEAAVEAAPVLLKSVQDFLTKVETAGAPKSMTKAIAAIADRFNISLVGPSGMPTTPQEVYTAVKAMHRRALDEYLKRLSSAEGAVGEVAEAKPIFVQDFEQARRELSQMYGAASTATDRRGVALVKRGFDEWFENVAEQELVRGPLESLEVLKAARAERQRVGEIFEPRSGSEKSGQAMQEVLHNNELTANQVVDKLFGGPRPATGVATEVVRRFEMAFGRESPEFAHLGQAAYLRAMQTPEGLPFVAKQAGAELDKLLYGPGAEFSRAVYTPEQLQSLVTLRGNIAQIVTNTVDAELAALIKGATRPGADTAPLITRALQNPADMTTLVNAFGKDPERLEALRRVVWDRLGEEGIGNTSTGIQTFLNRHRKALNQLYSSTEFKRLQDIADVQKRVYAATRTTGALEPGGTLDERLTSAVGTGVRGISTTIRNVAQGRGGYGDMFMFFGTRFLGAKQEAIYAKVMQKALVDPEYARYLLTLRPTSELVADLGKGVANSVEGMEFNTKMASALGSRAYLAARAYTVGETQGEAERRRGFTLPPAPEAVRQLMPQDSARSMMNTQFPRPLPPAPQTTGVPNVIPPARPAFSPIRMAAPGITPPPQQPGNVSQSRAMYQALFPRDALSTVMQQQQQQQQRPPQQ